MNPPNKKAAATLPLVRCAKQAIQQRLTNWRRDPDLASIRDRPALDRLADKKRAAWQALWRNVDGLAKQEVPIKRYKEPAAPKAKPEGRSLPPSGATGR
jgi:hypothetical protein